MTHFPGLGRRLSQRLRVLDYWKDGRPDVGRFCRERRYRPQYVYAWLKDRMPGYDNLKRLASDLEVPVVWLITGDDTSPRRSREPRRRRPGRAVPTVAAKPCTPMLDLSTLRTAAEKTLALSAELEAIMAALPDPCLWLDERGTILDVRGPDEAGIPPEAVGHTLGDAAPAEAATAIHRALSRVLRADAPANTEYTVQDGQRRRTYEARLTPLERNGPVRKVFVVLRDITDRKLRETEYREVDEGSANGLPRSIRSSGPRRRPTARASSESS